MYLEHPKINPLEGTGDIIIMKDRGYTVAESKKLELLQKKLNLRSVSNSTYFSL